MKQNVLTITQTDKTPLIEELLKKLADRHELIEKLDEENQKLKVEKQKSDEKIQKSKEKIQELEKTIRILKSEIAVLKKAPKRPLIRSNVKPKIAKDPLESSTPLEKRAGSEKKHKKLEIHETKILRPDNLPCDAKLKRTRKFDVQDLRITVHNIRYILEEWETADGQIYSAQMPSGVSQGHFGNELCSFILDQHHQCQVTQSLLYEQLTEFGIEISTGQIHNILTEDNELFHQEKNKILETALTVSSYIQVDDTGARHNEKTAIAHRLATIFLLGFKVQQAKVVLISCKFLIQRMPMRVIY